MEEKFFWVGILIGLHFFLSHHFREKDKFAAPGFSKLWHRVFLSIVGVTLGLLGSVILDNRNGEVVTAQLFTLKQVIAGLIGAFLGWIYVDLPFGKIKPAEMEPASPPKAKEGAPAAKTERWNLPKFIKTDLEWSETLFSATVLASVVMYLFIQAFKIPSGSMRNTFLEGDHLFVNKFIYGVRIPFSQKKILDFKKIKRGDIVIFRFPSEDPADYQCGGRQYGKDFIKRVIGLPGEKVEIRDGIPFIGSAAVGIEKYAQYADNVRYPASPNKIDEKLFQKYWENRQAGKLFSEYVRDNFGPVRVPENSYFVMGDNRDRSCDSRYWGAVPASYIKGTPLFIYWPLGRIRIPN